MSWLSGLTNSIGSIFGNGSLGDDISDFLPDLFSSSDLASSASQNDAWNGAANIASGVSTLPGMISGSSNTGVSMWPSIIGAGTQLAGSYFGQANNKDNAEAYALAQQNQIAADKERDALNRASQEKMAQMAAAASAGNARKSTLASLYNNWATNTAQGGANQAQAAIGAGKAITDGINARAAVLR